MKAQFRVLDGQEVIQAFEIEFQQAEDLNELFQRARKMWDEYTVEVDTESMTMSSSHSYAEEIKLSVAS